MVQPPCVQTKVFNYKNTDGADITVKIDRVDKCLNIVLKSHRLCSFHNFGIPLILCILIAGFAIAFSENVVVFAFLIAVVVFIVIFQLMSIVQEESLAMVKSLGYQLTTKYLIGEETKFIPWNQVQTLFINEVILRSKIIYLLSLLSNANDKETIVPLFLGLKPRLRCLEMLYRHINDVKS